ncbi:unnamed protein product [Closterium sp. NIES-64]|nr:unnamed protein product [Closterium sp. NIES-64]
MLITASMLCDGVAAGAAAESHAGCTFPRYPDTSWVHISKIPGYKVPYPLNCSKHFSCANVPPGKQHPSNYVWVPAPPCNYYTWKFNGKRFLKKMRNTVMAFVGDSLNDNMYEGIVCLLQATTRVVFKKVKFGNRRLGSYFVPNYNLTTLTINSGYLVQSPRYTTNHKTAVYTMNPKWATLLPYTDAIVFNAGHWFFHPPKDQTTPWYPIPVMSKALVTVRDYFAKANYKGAAVFFTFSPVHEKGYCNAAQPFPPNVQAENTLMSFIMPAMKKQVTVMKRSTMKVAEVTYMSAMRPDAHLFLNGKDCSHWCLPGVPDAWSDVLYNILMGVRRNFT